MATEEEQYLALRKKFQLELEEIAKEIERLIERRTVLDALLEGAVEDIVEIEEPEEETVVVTQKGTNRSTKAPRKSPYPQDNPDPAGTGNDLVQFLTDNPGSRRKEIDDALAVKGHSRYAVDKALKRLKSEKLLRTEGKTRLVQWYVK